MSSLTFLSVYLSGILLFLQLPGLHLQSEDFTPSPDYDSDYNATFDYSFFSNTSSDDLDRFRELFEDEDVTIATIPGSPARGGAASYGGCLFCPVQSAAALAPTWAEPLRESAAEPNFPSSLSGTNHAASAPVTQPPPRFGSSWIS